jgi:hypothetical protein
MRSRDCQGSALVRALIDQLLIASSSSRLGSPHRTRRGAGQMKSEAEVVGHQQGASWP